MLLKPVENVPARVGASSRRAQRVPLYMVELVRGLKRQGWCWRAPEAAVPGHRRLEKGADCGWSVAGGPRAGRCRPALAAPPRLYALLGTDFTAATAEGVVRELERDSARPGLPLDAGHATAAAGAQGLVSHRLEGLSFRNELLRDAVAATLPAAERQRIHRAAAAATWATRARASSACRASRCTPPPRDMRDEAAALSIDLASRARTPRVPRSRGRPHTRAGSWA